MTRNKLLLVLALFAGVGVACEEVPRHYSTQATPGEVVFEEDFSQGLGPHWRRTDDGEGTVEVKDGHLFLQGLRNHPLWLKQELPDDVRISFDAWVLSEEGDMKVEFAGDGKSSATSVNYVATGYVLIHGGWNNTRNVIARQDEHGSDRYSTSEPLPEPGKRLRVVIWRKGGELRFEVNGREVASFQDDAPLRGEGHQHFAFSGWEAPVKFDNLKIEAL